MTTPRYEFDVAVSFAGEDREFVEEIVMRLKNSGVRVFYDTDYQSAMWGEDLVEYLDQVYRVKARYAMIFISGFYARKMWTSHERRSALARALEQRTAYVLPVRLDSTDLDGLRPTTGYLDARVVGSDGIIGATLSKLAGAQPRQPIAITRVPRTEAERQQLLLMQPPAWEYLYFAGQLLHELNRVEDKYRDHEIRYAAANGEAVRTSELLDYMRRCGDDVDALIQKISKLVNNEEIQERAFGAPGQPGDPDKIAHLARRLNSVYEELMDWAASLRGVSVQAEFLELLERLANYVDGPVEQYRAFVGDFVGKVDAIPGAIAAGKVTRLEILITFSIPDEVTNAFHAELNRVKDQLS